MILLPSCFATRSRALGEAESVPMYCSRTKKNARRPRTPIEAFGLPISTRRLWRGL